MEEVYKLECMDSDLVSAKNCDINLLKNQHLH